VIPALIDENFGTLKNFLEGQLRVAKEAAGPGVGVQTEADSLASSLESSRL
jgi:hypothetical protein